MKRRDIALGLVAVIAAAWAVDRTMLEPRRVTAALDTLPRTTLAGALGRPSAFDLVVFLDDSYGWFLIEDVAAASNVEVGLPAERRAPAYCGDDTGRILWGVRAASITRELAFCEPLLMDLRALRGVARSVRLERDLLTREQVTIMAGEIAADPRRFAVTLPDDMAPQDRERFIGMPAVWSDARQPDLAAMRQAARAEVDARLAAFEGDYSLEFVAGPLPRIADPAGGSAAPVVVRDGAAVLLRGLTLAARPTLRVRCSPRACAALDGLDLSGALAPWRDHAVLRRAVDTAVPAPSEAPPGPLLTPQDLLAADTSVAPERPAVYPVRVAVLPR